MAIDFEREGKIYHKIIDYMLDELDMPYCTYPNDGVKKDFLSWEDDFGQKSTDDFYDEEGRVLCHSSYSDYSSHPFLEFFPDELDGWTMTRGWCRLVFASSQSNYVLKIPANFLCGRGVDFNQIEFETYAQAVKDGYDEAFAKCYKLAEYRGIPMLLMEQVDCNEEQNHEIVYETIYSSYLEDGMDEDEAEERVNDYDIGDSDSVMEFFNLKYGEDFTDWCDEMGLRDVHGANFGFRDNDFSQPVIIDYASY